MRRGRIELVPLFLAFSTRRNTPGEDKGDDHENEKCYRYFLEPFCDIQPFVCTHKISGMNRVKVDNHFQYDIAYDTDDQKDKSSPCRPHGSVTLFKCQYDNIYG